MCSTAIHSNTYSVVFAVSEITLFSIFRNLSCFMSLISFLFFFFFCSIPLNGTSKLLSGFHNYMPFWFSFLIVFFSCTVWSFQFFFEIFDVHSLNFNWWECFFTLSIFFRPSFLKRCSSLKLSSLTCDKH